MSLRHGQTREVLAHKVPADALIAPFWKADCPVLNKAPNDHRGAAELCQA